MALPNTMWRSLLLLLCLTFSRRNARAEDAYNYDDQYNAYAATDDYVNGGDYIKYWTEYAILPKRCIV